MTDQPSLLLVLEGGGERAFADWWTRGEVRGPCLMCDRLTTGLYHLDDAVFGPGASPMCWSCWAPGLQLMKSAGAA